VRSTTDRVPSLDAWYPVVRPVHQPWPQRHPVSAQRLTVGDYAMNNGAFMHRIPLMQFTVSMLGVLNRPLAGSWEALEPSGWSLWDPKDADVVWAALEPSRALLTSTDAIVEIVPDAQADVSSARTYPVLVTAEGATFTAQVWNAQLGWAVSAARLLPGSQTGPLITFGTTAGLLAVGIDGTSFTLTVSGTVVARSSRPVTNDYVYVLGLLVTRDEVRAVVQYGGRQDTMRYPVLAEPGMTTLALEFGGNAAPALLVYALAHGYETTTDLVPDTARFHTALTKIAGFLAC
jgi:hypothetical protein